MDVFALLSNLVIFLLLVFYKEKIREAQLIHLLNRNKHLRMEVSHIKHTSKEYDDLFMRIKEIVENTDWSNENKFTLYKLTSLLEINNPGFISNSIKKNGYKNFNHFLNTCKIDHAKRLINELLPGRIIINGLYRESGFSNQPTFNRVFKDIEGITPSAYIDMLNEKIKKEEIKKNR